MIKFFAKVQQENEINTIAHRFNEKKPLQKKKGITFAVDMIK